MKAVPPTGIEPGTFRVPTLHLNHSATLTTEVGVYEKRPRDVSSNKIDKCQVHPFRPWGQSELYTSLKGCRRADESFDSVVSFTKQQLTKTYRPTYVRPFDEIVSLLLHTRRPILASNAQSFCEVGSISGSKQLLSILLSVSK